MSSAGPERPLRWSLALRLNAWYAVVLVAGVAILAALAMRAVRRSADDEVRVVVEARLERSRALLVRGGVDALERALAASDELGLESSAVRLRDGAGRTVLQHGDLGAATAVATASVTRDLRLEVGTAEGGWPAVARHGRDAAVAVLFGTLALSIGGGIYVTRRALRPARELAEVARWVIDSRDLDRRVPERRDGTELDELAVLFNGVLAANARLVRGMREALDNVAHDLRTPLTRLRGGAELALRDDDPARAREALADCIEECDRVLAALRALMDISEAETGVMRLDRKPLDLVTVCSDVVAMYEQVAEDRGVSLELVATRPTEVVGDTPRLRQAVANLVDNAVKYTPRGGRVEVTVGAEAHQARVVVSDDGPGIAAQDRARIWDRLYRADPSRSERGLGLGLSLVRAIALAHGGTVDVTSELGRGARFEIALPIAEGAPRARA